MEYSVRLVATVSVDGDADELIEAVVTFIDGDERALGPVVSYDYEEQSIDAVFQLELARPEPRIDQAVALGGRIFVDALDSAHIAAKSISVSVVEGGDPDLLP